MMASRISSSQSAQLRALKRSKANKVSNPVAETLSLLALPPVFIFYAFLLPPEFEIYIGSVRFMAYRIALFASIPWVAIGIINGRFKPHIIDFLVLTSAIWPIFSWGHHKDFFGGLEAGGAIFIDIALAWMVARIAFVDPHILGKILRAILPAVIFIACVFFVESVSGRLIYRETFQAFLGSSVERGGILRYELRLGLLRAYGPFAHPIHAGILIASFAPLYLPRITKKWTSFSGLISSAAAIFTISSGAVLSLVIGIIFSTYQMVQLRIKQLSWRLFGVSLFLFLLFLQVFSQNGLISIIVRYIAFGGSGYFRIYIWEYCLIEIQNSPLFGIGSRPWNRPLWLGTTDTIDAHFLASATTMGLLASIPLLIAAFYINIRLFGLGGKHKDRYTAATVIPIAIVITLFNISAFVVAYWTVLLTWYIFLLGAGLTIIQMQSQRKLPRI